MKMQNLSPVSPDPIEIVRLFNDGLNAGDVNAMMALMTEACVFENTYPAPEGTRYQGQAAVRAFWEDFFSASRQARIEIEDIFGMGDRCVMRWKYHWMDQSGKAGYLRGVDVYRLEQGLIAEKLSYVKG